MNRPTLDAISASLVLALWSLKALCGEIIVVEDPVTTELDDEDAVFIFSDDVTIENRSVVTTNGQSADGLRTSGIGATVTNTAVGQIFTNGDDFAVGIRTAGDEIHISNAGTIETTGINGDGLIVFGNRNGEGLLIDRDPEDFIGNTVINSGTVVVNGLGADGFVVEGDRTTLINAGTMITNAGVRDTSDNGTGAFLFGLENRLENSGHLQSTGIDSTTVRIFDDSVVVNSGAIINSGGVSGDDTPAGTSVSAGQAIVLSGERSDLINSGTIVGGVVGAFGSQRVEVLTGSVIEGLVDVSLFDDTLETVSTDALVSNVLVGEAVAIRGSQFVGFDTLTNVGDGTLQISETLQLTEAAQGTIEQGTISLLDATLALNELRVGSGARLSGSGTVTGNLIVEEGGIVDPGFSPGTLEVGGDLTLDSGALLRLEFAGVDEGQFDAIAVAGDVDLGGAVIELNFTDAYLPTAEDTIEFLFAQTIIGLEEAIFLTPGIAGDFDFLLSDGGLSFVALSDAVAVPLPGAFGMLLVALALLPVRAHRPPPRLACAA